MRVAPSRSVRLPTPKEDSNGRFRKIGRPVEVRLPMKRFVDITLGTILAAASLPFIAVFALIVAVELRAWPFFVQERIGRYGVPFRMPKLRTLPKDIHPYTDKYSFGELLIPRFCRFLRDSHLDELPQLLLVPIGKMSLVGPRPKMPDWAEPIDPHFGWVRTRVRPGCTGLWQISEHASLSVSESPVYDYEYIESAGLLLDFWVIVWTVILVSKGHSRRSQIDIPNWVRGTRRWRSVARRSSILSEVS